MNEGTSDLPFANYRVLFIVADTTAIEIWNNTNNFCCIWTDKIDVDDDDDDDDDDKTSLEVAPTT